jgi:hypothetical protein
MTDQERAESYGALKEVLSNAVADKFGGKNDYTYVTDFSDTWVVFDLNGEKQQCSYTIDVDNTVDLGKATMVAEVKTYTPMDTKSATVPAVAKRHWSLHEYDPPQVADFQVRAASEGSTDVGVIGWPSVTGVAYEVSDWLGEYTETIRAGAFGKTLKESDYVPLLLDHRGDVLAAYSSDPNRTMDMAEDGKGLRMEAGLDVVGNSSSRTVVSGLNRRDYSKMSFAFRATKEEWNEDYTQRGVGELQLFDASIVKSPASKATSVGLRSDMLDILGREGIALMFATRSVFEVENRGTERPLAAAEETLIESAMHALRLVDERMSGDPLYRYSGRARTFIVCDLMEQVRAGQTLTSSDEGTLRKAMEALSAAGNTLTKVQGAIDETSRAIEAVVNLTPDQNPEKGKGTANDSAAGTGSGGKPGESVFPNDGGGTRSIPATVRQAQRELELIKLRANKR